VVVPTRLGRTPGGKHDPALAAYAIGRNACTSRSRI
jgi:hypothetical protein